MRLPECTVHVVSACDSSKSTRIRRLRSVKPQPVQMCERHKTVATWKLWCRCFVIMPEMQRWFKKRVEL